MTTKKFYYLFFAIILFQACNIEPFETIKTVEVFDEEEIKPILDTTLIKRIVKKTDDETSVINFEYKDNKLMVVRDTDGYTTVFLYKNEQLIGSNNYVNNKFVEYFTFKYTDDGVLSSYSQFLFDVDGEKIAYKTELYYVSDNEITTSVLKGDFNSQNEAFSNKTIIMEANNIIKNDIGELNYSAIEYDTKNSIYKNIFAIETLQFVSLDSEYGFSFFGSTKNRTKVVEVYNDGNTRDTKTYSYTYNESGYPVKAEFEETSTQIDATDTASTITYLYE